MKRLLKNRDGAAIVEFALVLVPLLHLFFGLYQMSMLYTANLVFKHAAVCAVRAYAVIQAPNPGGVGKKTDVQQAAQLALGPYNTAIKLNKLAATTLSTTTGPYGTYGLDTVKLTGTYTCSVPLGNTLVCGGATKALTATASFPHQGAAYK
jgi:Flp pilus assembly protein TadG